MQQADLIVAVAAYLLGSVPSGLWITRAAGVADIRRFGSGNPGAANILRSGRRDLAVLTLLADSGKAAAAVGLAHALAANAPVAALGAMLGNVASVWLRFRGGKGVATGFGATAVLAWPVALAGALAWLATAALSRISSAASLIAAAVVPAAAALMRQGPEVVWTTLAMSGLIALRHQANISRLLKGQEPRLGRRP